MRTVITIKNLRKAFGDFTAIENFNLEVEDGSITSILAPSGAGKTTLLRLISGLARPTDGRIVLDGKEIEGPSPEIGFMFQESSAFPWLTVKENIEFGLKLRANEHKAINNNTPNQILEICRELNIERFLDFYPSQLSGGQKQRVVIARSLILKSKIILCDEPFSALDEITRNDLRGVLLELHSHYLPTIIFITHSVEEAVFLGDRLVICSGPPLVCVDELDIEFFLPRNAALLDTEAFFQTRKRVKESLTRANPEYWRRDI